MSMINDWSGSGNSHDADSDGQYTSLGSLHLDSADRAVPSSATQLRHLLIIRDDSREQIIPLDDESYSIGRHHANSVVIANSTVSRQHAILLRIPTQHSNQYFFRIIDGNLQGQRSQNGIWLNGRKC
ncbi:MAG: FHA domain-containing protein [Cyanobacteria bacterium P01_F01_bin.42]